MNEEIWKDIEGWEGLYQISTLGRIKTLPRTVKAGSKNKLRTTKKRILKGHINYRGYAQTTLLDGKRKQRIAVHRLVGFAFIPQIKGKDFINHKNGIKADNRLENLEWVTAQENKDHSIANGFEKANFGENHGRAKLTEKNVIHIKTSNESSAALGKKYGVSTCHIRNIRNCKAWTHINLHPKGTSAMTTELAKAQEIDDVALVSLMPPGATKVEMELFAQVCRKTGLDPFSRQIYPMKRYDSLKKREVLSFQVSIDGFRVVAERNGQYSGQDGPYWCGKDGLWKDVWTEDEAPYAAKIGVLRKDFDQPLYAVAKFEEYAQRTRDGALTMMWKKMAANQIAKCAEALALRRAFPNDLSGLYTSDEMAQAAPATDPEAAKPAEKKQGAVKELSSEILQKEEPIEGKYEVKSDEPPEIDNESRGPFAETEAQIMKKLEKMAENGTLNVKSPTSKDLIAIMTMHMIPKDQIKEKFVKYATGMFNKEKWEDLTEEEKATTIKDAIMGVLNEPIPF